MTANLDLGGNKIINLKTPTADTDAASKIYIDETLTQSDLIASSKKNEFIYLDNPDHTSSEYNIIVNDFIYFNQSPHQNKKAYSITLQKDAVSNDYRSRMGFNLYPQPLGTYTMIFEFYPPEMTNIQLSCQATSAYIHKQVQRNFSNYKLIIDYHSGTYETQFTSDFQDKQLFIWICFDGSKNLYKMALSNYSLHVNETFNPPVNFQSNQLEIDYEGFVNKIGFIDHFIDVNSLEHHRIMLEEKRNGSYFE